LRCRRVVGGQPVFSTSLRACDSRPAPLGAAAAPAAEGTVLLAGWGRRVFTGRARIVAFSGAGGYQRRNITHGDCPGAFGLNG
jgi:fermentation-respiration switch protein FrsA (DUF1100 family)